MARKTVILSSSDLQEAVSYIRKQDRFIFDVEAQGENRGVPHLAQLSWISLGAKGIDITVPFAHPIGTKVIGEKKETRLYKTGKKTGQEYAHMVPVYEDPPEQISTSNVFEILRPLFWEPGITKGGHGVLYDLVSTAKYWGEVAPPPYNCTLIKQWLLNENLRGQLGLKDLVKRYWKVDYDPNGAGKAIETVPFDDAAYYTYCDTHWDKMLDNLLDPQIDAEGLRDIFNLEMDVLNVLIGMQLHGVRMDVPHLVELEKKVSQDSIEAQSKVYQAAGKKFNINSPKQKQEILYGAKEDGNQGLKPWKLTKTGQEKQKKGMALTIHDYSTDDSVLESYPSNKLAIALRDRGVIDKILNTYIRGWLGDGDEKPCIIFSDHLHTDFVQYGTVTGRFSCRNPNLQNIPRPYSGLGKSVRASFLPEEGGKLIVGDYSQIELVVLAHYLEQGKLYEAFQQGIDPHTMTAAMVLGKRPEDVTKEERQDLGKTLGFAVVYGAGINKIASMANVTPKRAKEVLARHAEMFPEIHSFREYVINSTRRRNPPYLTTLMGRKRRIIGLKSRDDGIRMGAERQTFNSLIQGGAADLMKYSMIRLDGLLPPEISLVMTVHDELVLTAPEYLAEDAAILLNEAMTGENIQKLVKVPLKVDIHICDKWSEAK